ncbi:choice-of-anchor U domain-containing protein, partial [Thalassotalea loyana]|uniref:choice-of-anchor U domain-containing protein n=1 Tax=Thalassotalea loyana TaxID=280483 RepID=UPI002ADD5C83
TDDDGVGDNADAFPNDSSETLDTDDDGVGDNADAFPNDSSETLDTDNDGVGNNADAFPNDSSETLDTDNDGVGDNADAFPNDSSETLDTDNDGVGDNADAFPNDSSETLDTDGDGIGNNQDGDDDGDGIPDVDDENPLIHDETPVIDTQAPTISGLENITVEATGTLTFVDVGTPTISDDTDENPVISVDRDSFEFSLGEHIVTWSATDESGNQTRREQLITVIDTTAPVFEQLSNLSFHAQGRLTNIANLIEVIATDLVDGEINASIIGETRLVSGRHTIEVQASDKEGNIAISAINVDVVPQLTIANQYPVEAGGSYNVSVHLSGVAADYPVQIAYSLLVNGFVNNQLVGNIEQGQYGQLAVVIPEDLDSSDDLKLQIDSSENAFIGHTRESQLLLTQDNVAPLLGLRVFQNEQPVSVIDPTNGVVKIVATVHDINQNDSHDIFWSTNHATITNEIRDADELTFEFDPSNINAGIYHLEASAIESNTSDSFSVSRFIQLIIAELPLLERAFDSDNDGINDADEGYYDSDGDGIADYLDNDDNNTRLPTSDNTQPLQTEEGLQISLGLFVSRLGVEVNQSGISIDELAQVVSDEDADTNDESFELKTPVYNFTVNGLLKHGATAAIVLPLADGESIPAEAVYRKYSVSTGWYNFVEDENNTISSAVFDDSGNCPVARSTAYSQVSAQGLVEGNNCIQLIIQDGGPNDADGMANGSIEDPGALTTQRVETEPNIAPDVIIEAHQVEVIEGNSISISAIGNDDNNDPLTYLWEQISGPAVSIDDVYGANISISAPEVSSDSVVELKVTVFDGELSQSKTTSFTILNKEEVIVVTPEPDVETSSGGGSLFWLTLLMWFLYMGKISIKLKRGK